MIALASGVLWSVSADAQTAAARAQAQVLFDKGRAHMKEESFAQACASFEASQRLHAAMGTQLNLAVCYEMLGKSASAWVNFLEIQTTARRLGQHKRAQFAQRRAEALAPKLSKLRVDVAQPVDGLTVSRGDVDIGGATWGSFVPVDPGEHLIEASAPGRKSWAKTVKVGADADQVSLTVPQLDVAPAEREADRAAPADASAGDAESRGAPNHTVAARDGTAQTILGWTAMGLGVAAGGVGVALRVLAIDADDQSNEHCSADDTDICTQEGADLRDEAQALELGSIIAWAGGGALLVTGLVVLLTAPSDDAVDEATVELDWRGSVSPDGARAGLRLRW